MDRARRFPGEKKELQEAVHFYARRAADAQNQAHRENYVALRDATAADLRDKYGVDALKAGRA